MILYPAVVIILGYVKLLSPVTLEMRQRKILKKATKRYWKVHLYTFIHRVHYSIRVLNGKFTAI